MNKIIDFLQSQSENEKISENSVDKNKLSKSFNDIKNIVVSSKVKERNIFQLKSRPKTKKGQIWLCKQQYFDAFGNKIFGNSPYLVFVVSDVDKIANESFVRIQPISPFIEFKTDDELLINDESVVGFKFIIEKWNEQPVLIDILDEFVGKIDIEVLMLNEKEIRLSEFQKEFRKTEIRNTAYLRQSVSSLLEYVELNNQIPVFLNIDNSTHFPEPENQQPKNIFTLNEPEQSYLLAAKKGKLKNRPTYYFDETINETDVKIKIVKDDDEYILSITEPEKTEIEVKDEQGNILKPASTNIYDGLKSGLYLIVIKGINQEIRIILK